MKTLTISTLTILLSSCTKMLYVPVERTRTITETLHDTVVITKLEKETTKQIVKDTTSHIDTQYASATATWHSTKGELEHEITTKDTPIEVRVQYLERVIIDSIPTPYHIEVDKIIEKPVRLPLRWWEQTLLWIGIATLTICAIRLLNKLSK